MKYIILTKSLTEGQKMQKDIVQGYADLNDIQCFTKEHIIGDPYRFKEVQYVFSTWYMPVFSQEELSTYLPSLKALFYAAGSVKYFAEPFLQSGVKVFSAAKANGTPVAEFVAAQVVLANKGYYLSQRSYKSLFWKWHFNHSRHFAEVHQGNYDAKVGLIGFGAVGKQVAEILKSYRLKVCVYDPYVSDEIMEQYGVVRADLDDLFRNCDVISNHLPDIPSTRDMLDKNLFSLMKDSVTFINTGRGSQVVEKDLSMALRKRKNACAVLDVTRHEPVFPWSPLLWNRKVFITPHIAGSLANEGKRLLDGMMVAYNSFIKGEISGFEVELSELKNKA